MRKIDRKLNLQKVNLLTEQRYLESKGLIKENFESVRIVDKNDFDKFIKSNPALGTIYDEDTNKFKIYLYADLVGYFDPKYGRIDYQKDSRFAKVSDEYTWDRNFNEDMDKAYGHGPY
jgi:hypothetical protein